MNYPQARSKIFTGITVRRSSWEPCRRIRRWEESDVEYINSTTPDLIVEDCQRNCDCKVGLYIVTHEDQYAEDWEIINDGTD